MDYANYMLDKRRQLIKRGFLVGGKLTYNCDGTDKIMYLFRLNQDSILLGAKELMQGKTYNYSLEYLYFNTIQKEDYYSEFKEDYQDFLKYFGLTEVSPTSHLVAILVCMNEDLYSVVVRNRLENEGLIYVEYGSGESPQRLKFDKQGNLIYM